MSFGFKPKFDATKKKNIAQRRSRGYIKCLSCNKVFYCDKFTIRSRGKKCKCGNLWVGIHKIEGADARHKFYIAVKYDDVRPEFGDKKIACG